MPRARWHFAAVVVCLLALWSSSCRTDDGLGPADGDQGPARKLPDPENSGKTLSGTYKVTAQADDYLPPATRREPGVVIEFTTEGGVKRRLHGGRALPIVEEGEYIISKENELILFYLKSGDRSFDSARVERFKIATLSEQRIELELSSGGEITLSR